MHSNLAAVVASDRPTRALPRRQAWLMAFVLPAVVAPLWMLLHPNRLAGHVAGTAAGSILAMLLVTCSATDILWRKIPNWATYPALSWAFAIAGVAAVVAGQNASVAQRLTAFSLPQMFAGAMVCFGVMFLIYSMAGGGAGDVKLMTAIGGFIGPESGIQALLWSYLIAATMIVAWSVWIHGPVGLAVALYHKIGSFMLPLWIAPPSADERDLLLKPMPLAPAFALGTLLVLAVGDPFQ